MADIRQFAKPNPLYRLDSELEIRRRVHLHQSKKRMSRTKRFILASQREVRQQWSDPAVRTTLAQTLLAMLALGFLLFGGAAVRPHAELSAVSEIRELLEIRRVTTLPADHPVEMLVAELLKMAGDREDILCHRLYGHPLSGEVEA